MLGCRQTLAMATPQTDLQSVHTDVSYESVQLEHGRIAMLDNLGSIPQITFQDFLKFLAPPQPAFDFDLMMESLKNDEVILPSGWWSPFERDPKDQDEAEHVVFSPLSHISNKVVDAIITNSQLTMASKLLKYLHEPRKMPVTNGIYNKPRPDGYLILK